jgi:hypothetical protein
MHYQCHITKNRVNIKAYQQKLVTDLCSRLARLGRGLPAILLVGLPAISLAGLPASSMEGLPAASLETTMER